MKVSDAAPFDPEFQLLVGIFDFNNRTIYQDPNRNGNSSQRNDVGVQPHPIHGNEGQQHRNGDRDNRNDGRGDVPEKEQDDETDNDDFHYQFMFQRFNRTLDQL